MFSSLANTKQWKVQIHLNKTVKIKGRTYKCQISINKVEASVNMNQE